MCSNNSQFADKDELLFVAENGEGKAGEACPEGTFWRLTFGFLAIKFGKMSIRISSLFARGVYKRLM